jgi:choline dehydrogenase-like flavoprotein
MVYIRGHRSDYDGWAALGNPGWAYDDVLPYFKKSENNEIVHDAFHGTGGPLNVANIRTGNPFQEYFLEAGRQLQLPMNADFNGAHQMGLGVYQVTQKNGERWSAARAYIEPNLSRPNLKVVTGASARKILFDGKRAVGVEFSREGKSESARARREVILSGGAFQSPQLLMLSGIGNAPDLKSLGIGVVHHSPGVGQNLQDHIDFAFSYRSKSLDNFGITFAGLRKLWREIGRYRRDGVGMITSNVAECGGFLKTDPALPVPDIQLHFSVGMADNHGRTRHLGHGFGCHVCLLRPKSRGSVALNSADPAAADRSEILRFARRSRGDGESVQNHPPDHGRRAAGEMAHGRNVQRERSLRRRDPHDPAQPLRHGLPSRRHRPHGHRRCGGGRSAIARGWGRGLAGGGRLHHADLDRR